MNTQAKSDYLIGQVRLRESAGMTYAEAYRATVSDPSVQAQLHKIAGAQLANAEPTEIKTQDVRAMGEKLQALILKLISDQGWDRVGDYQKAFNVICNRHPELVGKNVPIIAPAFSQSGIPKPRSGGPGIAYSGKGFSPEYPSLPAHFDASKGVSR